MSVEVTPRPAACAPLPRWATPRAPPPRAAGGIAGEEGLFDGMSTLAFLRTRRQPAVGHSACISCVAQPADRVGEAPGGGAWCLLRTGCVGVRPARMAQGDDFSLAAAPTGLLPFLESLPPAAVEAAYASRWTCAALVRALPPLAKHVVMRLVHVDTAVPTGACVAQAPPVAAHMTDWHTVLSTTPLWTAADIRAWARQEVESQQESALRTLRSLRVLVASTGPGGVEALALNPTVQAYLRQVLYDTAPEPTPELPHELQARM